jgi:hypothetical protein
MQKYCTPHFVFKRVYTWPYYVSIILMAILLTPMFVLFLNGWYLYLGYGGKSLIFVLNLLLIMIVLNPLAKSVTIYFDRKHMYVGDAKKDFESILSRDVVGFYSHNYERNQTFPIWVELHFKNRKKLVIYELNGFKKLDPDDKAMLKAFLIAAQRRLNFTCIRKNRWRSFFGMGAYWYSATLNEETV